MHKWLATTIFPKEELGTVRNEEMKLLYAMIKKKTKPVTCQINVALLDHYSCHEEVQNSIYIMGHTNCYWVRIIRQCHSYIYSYTPKNYWL
jgi:hypothetical protein